MTYWNQWCPMCTSNETMQNCEGCRRGVSKPTEWVGESVSVMYNAYTCAKCDDCGMMHSIHKLFSDKCTIMNEKFKCQQCGSDMIIFIPTNKGVTK